MSSQTNATGTELKVLAFMLRANKSYNVQTLATIQSNKDEDKELRQLSFGLSSKALREFLEEETESIF
jgi:hypothetical protein